MQKAVHRLRGSEHVETVQAKEGMNGKRSPSEAAT
jgi:hypothetical protein